MRGTEIVANMVDKVFLATLTTQRSGGPASKHHAPNGNQLPPHPCFVLQLTCPPEAFDVLQEPDKSKAVFTDPYGLQLCVMDLLLKLFEVYRPDLLPSVRQVCSEHRNSHWANRGRSGNNDSRNTEIDNYRGADVCSVSAPLTDSNQFYAVRTKDHMRTILTDQKPNSDQYYPIDHRNFRQPQSDSPDPTVFKKAFLETPPVERHTTEYDTSQPVSLFAEFEFITASNISDSVSVVDQRAGYTDSVDDSQYPAHVDTVTRETETDVYELSDDEITLRSNEETSIKGMGVTVSRLPGLIEYIDDQLNNFGSQLSAGTDQCERALSPDSESCYALHFQQSTEADEEDALSAADEMQGGNNSGSYTPISAEGNPRSYESPQWQPIQDIKSKADCEDDYYHKEDRADEFPDMLSVEYFDRSTKVRRAIDSAAGAVNLPTSSTCRVDLNNTVFADAFFKASPDGKSLATSAPANQGSGLSFPIGTQRFKDKKISSLKDKQSPSYSGDDFASYNGAIKKPKVVVRPPTTMTTAMTLRKEMLTNLRTIGQVDSKYLLAVSGKLILIVDQHAADERVKLEQFLQGGSGSDDRGGLEAATSQKLSSSVRERSLSGTQAVSEQISLTESDMYTLITRRKVFSEWKFIFDHVTIPDSDSITSKVLADCPRLRSADDMRTVRLTQVPLVYGEALTGHDFVEFIQSLSGHDSLIAPLSLLQPPSLRRIAASKACRTAIRFGDKLSLFECSDIMKKLSRTELPFQCAHGRPSVVPLLILDRDVSPTGCGGRLTELPNGKAVKLPSYSNFLKRKLM